MGQAISRGMTLMGIDIPIGWRRYDFTINPKLFMYAPLVAFHALGYIIGIIELFRPMPPRKPSGIDYINGNDEPWPMDWDWATNRGCSPPNPHKRDDAILHTVEQRRQYFREFMALMNYIESRKDELPASDAFDVISHQDIDPDAIVCTIHDENGVLDWVAYRPEGQNRTRLYHVRSVNSTIEAHREAILQLEISFIQTLQSIVAATHGLIADIGAAKFYELLEKGLEDHVHTTEGVDRTLVYASLEGFAQDMIDSAYRHGYLSSQFKCGHKHAPPCPNINSDAEKREPHLPTKAFVCGDEPPMVPCPDHPVGGPFNPPNPQTELPTAEWGVETESLAQLAAAVVNGENTDSMRIHHATSHGPVVPLYVSTQASHPSPSISASSGSLLAAAVATFVTLTTVPTISAN